MSAMISTMISRQRSRCKSRIFHSSWQFPIGIVSTRGAWFSESVPAFARLDVPTAIFLPITSTQRVVWQMLDMLDKMQMPISTMISIKWWSPWKRLQWSPQWSQGNGVDAGHVYFIAGIDIQRVVWRLNNYLTLWTKLFPKGCDLTVWTKLFPKGLRCDVLNQIIFKARAVSRFEV